jgi:hypothetical protein
METELGKERANDLVWKEHAFTLLVGPSVLMIPVCPKTFGREIDFSSGVNFVVKIEAHYDNTSGQPQQDQSGM